MRIITAAIVYFFTIEQVLAAGCVLPTTVSTEVGRGQGFASGISDLAVLGDGIRHYLWAENSPADNVPAGLHAGRYIPSMRSTSYYNVPAGDYTVRHLQWYRDNHPEWIVYRPDRKTPAWQFCFSDLTEAACDAAGTSMAIWDAAYRTYVLSADIKAAADTGLYKAISFDNAALDNTWYKAGTCDIDPGSSPCPIGNWTSRYTNAYATVKTAASVGATSIAIENTIGTFATGMRLQIRSAATSAVINGSRGVASGSTSALVKTTHLEAAVSVGDIVEAVDRYDQIHIDDVKSWLAAAKTGVNALDMCLTVNIAWNNDLRTDWLAAVDSSHADLLYNEIGYTGTSPATDVEDGSMFHDATWINKVSDYIAAGRPTIDQNGSTSNALSNRPRMIYGLATHLLAKGDNSYNILWSGLNDDIPPATQHRILQELLPDTYWQHGAAAGPMTVTGGVYNRTFANGLPLVNPSSTATVTYNLGASVYNTSDGLRYTGVVSMAPVSGLILRNGAPATGRIVLTR